MHRKTPFICECGWIRTNLMFKTGYSRSPCQSDYTLIIELYEYTYKTIYESSTFFNYFPSEIFSISLVLIH